MNPHQSPIDTDRRAALTSLASLGVLGALALAHPVVTAPAHARHEAEPAPKPHNPNPFANILGFDPDKNEFTLSRLPYEYNALEPHIDAQTMEIHHTKHHQAYVNGLNKAIAELAKARDTNDFALVKHWSRELAFHGGGHLNHAIFWHTMAPPGEGPGNGGGKPTSHLAKAIDRDFGSFEKFTAHFSAAANAVEGAGWAWLVLDRFSGRLMVQQMEKQQDMLLTAAVPLIGLDVWEHAYYLKYQNKRADYVKAWWNVVAWQKVAELYAAA